MNLLFLSQPSAEVVTKVSYLFVQPIPVEYLVVEAVDDGEIKLSGSFRGNLPTANAGMYV